MRQSEDLPMDPDVIAELEAIDATLRGEAVDPIHAELAELALLLAVDRSTPSRLFADYLDDRVATRFAPIEPAARRSHRRWALRPVLGVAAAGLAAAVVVVVVLTSGGSPPLNVLPGRTASFGASSSSSGSSSGSSGSAGSASSTGSVAAASTTTTSTSAGAPSHALTALAPGVVRSPASLDARVGRPGAGGNEALTTPSSAKSIARHSSAAPAAGSSATGAFAPAPQISFGSASGAASAAPVTHGRAEVQSAALQLIASGNRIETVAQELFTVVGVENGIVRNSQITAAGGNGGFANFSLSIPSGNLAQTLTQLSELRYAHVSSRTDATQDVNNRYLSDQRDLAEARALRTSLLKQLAAATTETAITSLTAQIHDADASISSDEATLHTINHAIDYSNLSVQINAGSVVVPVARHNSTGFTIGKAGHDSVRVLTVAAGVALIVLAALVPFALLAALWIWITYAVRRRRREQALDAP